MILVKCLALLLVATTVFGDYTGYQLLRFSPKTKEQIDLVGSWMDNPDFDVWSTRETFVDVALSPEAFRKYKPQLEQHGIEINVLNRNIQNNVDEEARSIMIQKMQLKASNQEGKVVGTFARYADVNAWLNLQAATYPTFLTVGSAGKSYEGREMQYITFSRPTNTRRIWIDCGIHAREWISPATCIWIIDSLIKDRDTRAKAILDKYTIQILPLHNPDGYEYSFTAGQRLWRKNRRINAGSTCVGVDLNRNFGFQWMVAGASNQPCSDTYAGPTPDSEAETKAVESEINKFKGQWDIFYTIHTYGLWWFTPWGYTSALPSDYTELVSKCNIGAAAAKAVYGSVFVVGSSTNLLYAAAGGSDDWAKGVAGIKYSHCVELRPGNSGTDASYGFQLPVDRVPFAGEETYVGFLAQIAATP